MENHEKSNEVNVEENDKECTRQSSKEGLKINERIDQKRVRKSLCSIEKNEEDQENSRGGGENSC